MNQPTDKQMQSAFDVACTPKPSRSNWLFFGYSDVAPMVCGSGTGAYHWFESSKEMVKFIEEYFCWYHPGPSGSAPEQIAAEVQRIIRQGREDKIDGEELRTRLNDYMRNMWQIAWWGTFDELCQGKAEFARDERRRFRDEGSDKPIRETEMEDFVEYLTQCGA